MGEQKDGTSKSRLPDDWCRLLRAYHSNTASRGAQALLRILNRRHPDDWYGLLRARHSNTERSCAEELRRQEKASQRMLRTRYGIVERRVSWHRHSSANLLCTVTAMKVQSDGSLKSCIACTTQRHIIARRVMAQNHTTQASHRSELAVNIFVRKQRWRSNSWNGQRHGKDSLREGGGKIAN